MRFSKEEIRNAMLLYAITDQMWLKDGESLLSVCKKVLANGATFLQIREKDLDEENFLEEAKQLHDLCIKHRVPFVVNDNVEIAIQCGADGVHVGQSDIKGRDIRSLIGADKILGISAGTAAEAIAAQKAGADYLGVGAVFATGTKKDARNLSITQLQEICRAVSIPVVAIGGINASNLMQLKGSGVDGIAVISAIFAAENTGAATDKLLKLAQKMVKKED